MPSIKKQARETYNKLKQILRKIYQGSGKQQQWVLQPIPVKRIEGAVPRH